MDAELCREWTAKHRDAQDACESAANELQRAAGPAKDARAAYISAVTARTQCESDVDVAQRDVYLATDATIKANNDPNATDFEKGVLATKLAAAEAYLWHQKKRLANATDYMQTCLAANVTTASEYDDAKERNDNAVQYASVCYGKKQDYC